MKIFRTLSILIITLSSLRCVAIPFNDVPKPTGNNNIGTNNNISQNLNDLNKEERLEVLRKKYLETNRFKNIKLKMVRKQ